MYQNIWIVILLTLLFSCSKDFNEQQADLIPGLASPVLLNSDTTFLYLTDYTPEYQKITSINFPDCLLAKQINDSVYQLVPEKELQRLSEITINREGESASILCIKPVKHKITFKYKADKTDNVRVIGSMNKWNRLSSKMVYNNGYWEEIFYLSPGIYQYLFVVNGKDVTDPENDEKIDNNIGGYNSLLKVGKYKPEDLPTLSTLKYNNKTVTLGTTQELDDVFSSWQNKRIEHIKEKNRIIINIPKAASRLNRSFIRCRAFNENGISNDILIPLNKGKVLKETNNLSRCDKHAMIIYFMMIDRFFNGNKSNDEPVNDPDVLPKANFFGGDLAGVKQKINEGYFKDLGVNTIWLSPIVQNPLTAFGRYPDPFTKFSGYHGYWPISSVNIDYRFGTSEEFHELVEDAHQSNMNVLLDYVANHVHEEHPIYQQHPDWATGLYLPDGTLNTEKWDEYRLTTWFDTFLPTLDLRRPEVVYPLVDSALFWFKEYNIDGFRHDATKHIDELYWRTLTRRLKEISNSQCLPYQIGETYGSPELINSYISTGMLDGQFDFNVYDDAIAVFARDQESFERLKNSLSNSLQTYGYHNLMGYISGNQDRARFISYAGGALSFNEDSKYAGWTRNIGVGDSSAYSKLKMFLAFNMTIPGIPVIYYGDEIGMPGGNDPDNRRWMKFENLTNQESEVYITVKKLINIRKSNLSLLYGDTSFLNADNNSLIYSRRYFNEITFIIFNKGSEIDTFDIQVLKEFSGYRSISSFSPNYKIDNNKLIVQLGKNEFQIITFKK